MKIFIALSVLILAAAADLGWHDHQRLAAVRERHEKLVAEAATLGIALAPSLSAAPVRITKRERANHEADARRRATGELIASAKEMEAMEENDDSPDGAMEQKVVDILDRMMSLDSTQLGIVIAELHATKDLKDETREELMDWAIKTLANDHPQAALALLAESSVFKEKGMEEYVISSSLVRWAQDDPLSALEWVKKNNAKFPDLVTDDVKCGLAAGAAANDPKLAFKLIGELGIKESTQAICGIMGAVQTPEERTEAIVALREHLATLPDEKARNELFANSMKGGFGYHLVQEGFEAATRWIEGAKLNLSELEGLISSLNLAKSGEGGQWIEWLGEKLPTDKSAAGIRNMVRNWTQEDCLAAGKWLAATPDGPAKNSAIRSYAESIAEYEPETAAQWALTLPPGKDREETLKRIHSTWTKDDAAGKEAYAKEHGIK